MSVVAGPPGCGCSCHRMPGVKHIAACCDAPPYREDKIKCPLCYVQRRSGREMADHVRIMHPTTIDSQEVSR